MTTERRTIIAHGAEEAVEKIAGLCALHGGTEFELSYTAAERDLADGEEPRDDERVRWTARTVIRRKLKGRRPTFTTYTGEAVLEPGEPAARGASLAVVRLAEKLGANVILLDMTTPL